MAYLSSFENDNKEEGGILETLFAGPIERFGAVKESIKTKSLDPLKESFQKQGEGFVGDLKNNPVSFALSFSPGGANVKAVAEIRPINKLLDALKGAGTARKTLEKAYTVERAVRATEVSKVFSKEAGQKGYLESLGKLKGELAPDKKVFTSLNIAQEDIDGLFNQIQKESNLDIFERISASNGLQKLLNGEIPSSSQLSYLEDIFGSDLVQEVLKKRPILEKAKDFFTEVMNVPRSLITSFDMSAPLRQGVMFTVTKPKQSIPATKEMFKDFFSESNFQKWFTDLPNHPQYRLMKDSNLYIANPNKISGGLSAQEEKFMTNLAEKIPIWGKLVKASERSYVGYLNKLRVDVFDNLSAKFIKDGVTPQENPEVFKSLANFVNTATGRGDLGKLNRISQELNTVFFSPRLIASRLNLLNPVWYAKQSPQVRKEAIKSFAEFIGVGSSVLALFKAAGADVELDSRSSDFGKIRVGNSRWDIWGGFQQWVRMFSQIISGQRKTGAGDIVELTKKQYPFETRKDVLERFLSGKLAPVPGLAYELLQGQKLFGQDITIPQELIENTIPLYVQDLNEAINQMGPDALITIGVPGFFGVGTQTYEDKSKTRGRLSSFK